MKKKLVFSLVVYGKSYVDTFVNYSLSSLIQNISNINKEKYTLILYLSCTEQDKKKLITNLEKHFDLIEVFNVEKVVDKNSKYSMLSTHQYLHNWKSKDSNYDYIIYLYADFIFGKNAILNSLEIIDDYTSLFTFALLLNSKKKNFSNFIKNLNKNKNPLSSVIEYDLIDNYHKSFKKSSFNISKSFSYTENNKDIFLKAFHMHPIIINLNRVKREKFNKKFYTLDNGFLKILGLKENEIFVQEDLNKVCIFSFDKISRLKRLESNLTIDKTSFDYIDKGFFYLNYNNHSNIECWLFDNFTLTNNIDQKINNEINFHYKSMNVDKKEYFTIKMILNQGINYIKSSRNMKDFTLNYFSIFFYVFLLTILYIMLRSKILLRLYNISRKTIFSSIQEGFLKRRSSSPNLICSIYISKAIFSYSALIRQLFFKNFIHKVGLNFNR